MSQSDPTAAQAPRPTGSVSTLATGDVLVSYKGDSVQLSKGDVEALQRAGFDPSVFIILLQLFGPVLVKLLQRIIDRRFPAEDRLRFDLSFLNPKAMLVMLLKEYKETIGQAAEQAVEAGIDALIATLGG